MNETKESNEMNEIKDTKKELEEMLEKENEKLDGQIDSIDNRLELLNTILSVIGPRDPEIKKKASEAIREMNKKKDMALLLRNISEQGGK